MACSDADGNPCDFEFTLQGTNGVELPGSDCGLFFSSLPSTTGEFSYGYLSDYQYLGNSYGSFMMQFDDYNNVWSPTGVIGSYAYQSHNYVPSNNSFDYTYWQGIYYFDANLLP